MVRSVPSAPRAYRTPGGAISATYARMLSLPHLLIAGATGSGKSTVINGLIYTAAAVSAPSDVALVLCDPKRVELVQYTDLPHTIDYSADTGDILRSLRSALDITDGRFREMQSLRVREYPGGHIYVIIDELGDLMTTSKKDALPLLQRLAQIGRAAHVHLIGASQNIMAATIPTVLKCNFPAVLGLRTATAQQSRYLISVQGCESLPDPKRTGKCQGFLRDGADLDKVQLHRYTDGEVSDLVNYWTSPACIAG